MSERKEEEYVTSSVIAYRTGGALQYGRSRSRQCSA
jgi:hypothetical protein